MKNITDKLQSRGAQALTDEELVAVALAENPNDDSACAMAEEVLKTAGGSLVRLAEDVVKKNACLDNCHLKDIWSDNDGKDGPHDC